MVVECEQCQAVVDAKVVSFYDDVDDEAGAAGRYSFLKCPKCHSPFLVLQVDFGGGLETAQRLYPPLESGLDATIPPAIRAAFQEARTCLRAKAHTAAAIMCRKTLEAVAAEVGVSTRNLASALTAMRDKGLIETRLYQWADALRVSGNEAAHDVNIVVSPQDARDIVDFTSALLEYVFTFQRRFDEFTARRMPTPSA